MKSTQVQDLGCAQRQPPGKGPRRIELKRGERFERPIARYSRSGWTEGTVGSRDVRNHLYRSPRGRECAKRPALTDREDAQKNDAPDGALSTTGRKGRRLRW